MTIREFVDDVDAMLATNPHWEKLPVVVGICREASGARVHCSRAFADQLVAHFHDKTAGPVFLIHGGDVKENPTGLRTWKKEEQ